MKMTARLFTPKRFEDARGWFCESWRHDRLLEAGIEIDFCQDNHSYTAKAGTIRGMHFQTTPYAQAKLVRCIVGRIFDVVVDVRRASPTFGKWEATEMSAALGNQIFVPAGYAHGFLTLEDHCEVVYKVDRYYAADADQGITWSDPDIAIDWPLFGVTVSLSTKDEGLPLLRDFDLDFPYDGNPLLPLTA